MCGLERWDDAFRPAESLRGFERVLIAAGAVFGASTIMQPRVLGADGSIVKARRNRVRQRNLAMVVLQDVAAGSMQHAGNSSSKSGCVLADCLATSAGFDADEAHVFIL